MQQVRICWNHEVSRLKRESTTSSAWAESSPGLLNYFDVMVQAGNTVFGPGTHWCETREARATSLHPEVAVRQLLDDSMKAWVDGDITRHVGYFTPSAVFVTPTGECLRGHSALQHAFQIERSAMPALQMAPKSIEIFHPAQDTAIVLMKGLIHHSGSTDPEPWSSTQTVVHTDAQEWKIASLQVYHPR
ncbi:YybH family protein [Hydrogenophaga palleronii]|uniref:YybH family protein n=1 Tax=Hydrogenophaga palleronii TaxID=65655 RepID=UPI000AAB6945|nr:nuclear transport factor 2 family protein [Hydrogenophaga palleronii]